MTHNTIMKTKIYYQPGKRTQVMEKRYEIRKTNLHLLIEQHKGPTTLAKILGYNGPSYLSQMAGGHRHVTEENARRIERAHNLPEGWMDVDHTGEEIAPQAPQPPAICTSLLREVVRHVATALEESNIKLPPHKLADFVAMVYEEAAESGRIDARFIQRTVKLIS